jgi:hypothetical protein
MAARLYAAPGPLGLIRLLLGSRTIVPFAEEPLRGHGLTHSRRAYGHFVETRMSQARIRYYANANALTRRISGSITLVRGLFCAVPLEH